MEKRNKAIDVRKHGDGLWKTYHCTGCHLACTYQTRGDPPLACPVVLCGVPVDWWEELKEEMRV
jgi:hypothetical protein